jgi:hypothetical protein
LDREVDKGINVQITAMVNPGEEEEGGWGVGN